MQFWSRTTLRSLLVPGGILLAGVALAVHSGWLVLTAPALNFLFYCAFIGGLLLAWRFHSSRILFALFVAFLGYQAVVLAGGTHALPGTPAWTVLVAVAGLVPLNFVLIGLSEERGFTVSGTVPLAMFLFVQMVIVAVLALSAESASTHLRHPVPLPSSLLVVWVGAAIILLIRALVTRKPADSALFWSLGSFVLSLQFVGTARISAVYSIAALTILAASVIETSYLLAYQDELTSLPSRRAFNDALLRLQHPYSIAAVDIDHFKKFNDTYGHDVGDQVLRLVASKLARVTGGGQAYRCGGEEFVVLFPGKTSAEVLDHAEQLRKAIGSAEFHMRGGERRQTPRGADRRNPRARGRARKADAIRQLAQEQAAAPLSVTVSIGVAASSPQRALAESIMQAADKALYRAKANGRNRVEAAMLPRRTGRAKASGVA